MAQTTTIQVQFGRALGDTAAHLSAEIDDRDAGLNNGDTDFDPGDTAWFLIFKSSNVTISSVTASAGSVTGGSQVTVSRTEDVTFADANQASLQVPAQAISSYGWIGNDLGALTLEGDKQTVTSGSKGVAVCRVTYTANAIAYAVTSPTSISIGGETSTDFPILVLIIGDVA